MTVLVTGADQRQGLAVIRSLGRGGIPVIAAGPHPASLGFSSRYAKATWIYPSPLEKPDDFIKSLVEAAQRFRLKLIMPVVESTLVVLNENRERIEKFVPLATASREAVQLSLDKQRQFKLAEEIGIPLPKTISPFSIEEAEQQVKQLTFPLVIKPSIKPSGDTGEEGAFKVSFVNSWESLKDRLTIYYRHGVLPVVQELSIGSGIGCGVMMDRGTALCCYQYHRGREFLPTGGVPVRYESMPLWPNVKELSVRLLRAMNWNGVAQVEWKNRPGTKDVVLMEVNGRFWASLPGSVHAGMNFPLWQYELWEGKPSHFPKNYREGIASRFLRGDLNRLEYRLRNNPMISTVPLREKKEDILDFFLDFFRWKVKSDIFSWDDPVPGLKEAYSILSQLLGRAVQKIFKRNKSNHGR